MINTYQKTSESVSNGHPDKVADQLADAIFDYLRTLKKDAQSAVEVSCSANKVFIFGEIDADIVKGDKSLKTVDKIDPQLTSNIRTIVEDKLSELGYSTSEIYSPEIIFDLVIQSGEINNAVEDQGEGAAAGDQGIVTGYADNETTQYHALHYWLANRLITGLQDLRKNNNEFYWLYPDAKSQVTVTYDADTGKPLGIDNILVSQSYRNIMDLEEMRAIMHYEILSIIKETIKETYNGDRNQLIDSLRETKVLVNPAGAWTEGYGPIADSGLTSRKLVVDNYGSAAPIGGGGQSGKNANKVDRSGACYARWIAKNVVAKGYADKCLVEIGFAIGVKEAVSLNVDTLGTGKSNQEEIVNWVKENFPMTVDAMIQLCDQIDNYADMSANGFYTNDKFPWEKLIVF